MGGERLCSSRHRKISWLQHYPLIFKTLLHISFSNVIVLGDINTSHQRIDHCDPSDNVSKYGDMDTVFVLLRFQANVHALSQLLNKPRNSLLCLYKSLGGFWWKSWKEMAEFVPSWCQKRRGRERWWTSWIFEGNINTSRPRWEVRGHLSLFPPNSNQCFHLLVHAHWSATDQLRHTHWLHICEPPAGLGAVCGGRYHARGGGVRPLSCVGAVELLTCALH